MDAPSFIEMDSQPLERYRDVPRDAFSTVVEAGRLGRDLFNDRILWQLNSTHLGGGMGEMLRAFLPYPRDVGVDSRWVVINGDPEFFSVTKRIHNRLHGHPGDAARERVAERSLAAPRLAQYLCVIERVRRNSENDSH